jgi:hypothetical protein
MTVMSGEPFTGDLNPCKGASCYEDRWAEM